MSAMILLNWENHFLAIKLVVKILSQSLVYIPYENYHSGNSNVVSNHPHFRFAQ